jgi:biopolymer transport protein ExbD
MNRTLWIALALVAGLSACSKPSVRQRVDVQIGADGSCVMAGQPLACRDVGAQAAAKYSPNGVSVVLLNDRQAPHASALAVRDGLLTAHISHVQHGDTVQSAAKRSEAGLD